jgi:hypothetical protein
VPRASHDRLIFPIKDDCAMMALLGKGFFPHVLLGYNRHSHSGGDESNTAPTGLLSRILSRLTAELSF